MRSLKMVALAGVVMGVVGGMGSLATASGPNMFAAGYWGNGRALATPRPYAPNRVDDVSRPGFNGREWIGRPNIGPRTTQWPLDWSDPGPAAYGAGEYDDPTVYALVGQTVVTFSPWEAFEGIGLSHLESARQDWLKEQGYTGGVRTFRNEAYSGTRVAASKIEPRATIQLGPEITKFKSRMQVRTPAKSDSIVVVRAKSDPVTMPGTAPGTASRLATK
jgi:hypothetical protein